MYIAFSTYIKFFFFVGAAFVFQTIFTVSNILKHLELSIQSNPIHPSPPVSVRWGLASLDVIGQIPRRGPRSRPDRFEVGTFLSVPASLCVGARGTLGLMVSVGLGRCWSPIVRMARS